MYIKKLTLSNFRNYKQSTLEFSRYTNIIYGDNARGKTNLLEAVHLLATTKSHRASKERELIFFDQEQAKINIEFFARDRDYVGEIVLGIDKKKQYKINGINRTKTSEILGLLNVVMFSPEDLQLIKGAPRARRRMIDMAICQLKSQYLHLLLQFNKILQQRNILLRQKSGENELWAWNQQLCETGGSIIWYRNQFLQKVKHFARLHQEKISGEILEIEYRPNDITEESLNSREEIKKAMEKAIVKNLAREYRFGQTLVGPHRDDFLIKINGKEARLFASQGQQRTAALALRLAELEIIFEQSKDPPVLLLDDILSELDGKRRAYVLENFNKIQAIITCTKQDFSDIIGMAENVKLINIEDIKKEEKEI